MDPIPETAAKVGVTVGPEANPGATVEPRSKIVPKAAHGMYILCPLMDPIQKKSNLQEPQSRNEL